VCAVLLHVHSFRRFVEDARAEQLHKDSRDEVRGVCRIGVRPDLRMPHGWFNFVQAHHILDSAATCMSLDTCQDRLCVASQVCVFGNAGLLTFCSVATVYWLGRRSPLSLCLI